MFRESICEKMCSGTVGCETACSGRFCCDQVCSGRGGFAKCIPGGMALRERVPGRCSGNIDSKLKSKMQSTMKMSVELPAVASCHFKRGRPILLYDRICVRPVSFICLAIAIVLLLYVIGCNS